MTPLGSRRETNTMASKRFITAPTVSAAAVAVSLSALLTGCGGGSTKASSNSTTTVASPGGQAATGAGNFPGAFGSVAALSGSTMEVQNATTGQTTVSWTSTTSFVETVTETEAALTPGVCATVTATNANGKLTARSITISAPSSSGTCADRRGAGAGGVFTRPPGTPPSGSVSPSSIPGGTRSAGPGNFSLTSGKVVSASGSALVLYGTTLSGGLGRRTASSSTTTVPASDITVTLASATSYTEQKTVTAASLAVGDCVAATGTADDTGAVAARTVRITSTGGQDCSSAFVGGFGGGGGFAGGGGAGGAAGRGQTAGSGSGAGG
jgi:hypothetical protein